MDPFQARPEPYLWIDVDADSLGLTIEANFGYQGPCEFRFDLYSDFMNVVSS
jgi:hypothetical protein